MICTTVSYVHVTRRIDSNTVKVTELTISLTITAKFSYEFTVAIKLLNTIIAGISYVNITSAINSNTNRVLKLAITRTIATPLGYEFTTTIKLLNTIMNI